MHSNSIAAPGSTFMNVHYATAPDWKGSEDALTMDIYLPAGANGLHSYPVMMMIHGGAFAEGDKKDMAPHCSLLADSGYVGVSINYRLGWNKGNSRCGGDTLSEYAALYRGVQDANAALRYLVANRKLYHIDTSRIFIGGGSAGSTIALYTTYLPSGVTKQRYGKQYAALGELNNSGNTLTNTYTIKGLLNMWGATGDSTIIQRDNAVPMISFHGTDDVSSPYNIGYEFSCTELPKAYGSACLSRQLIRYGVPCVLHLKAGAGHAPAAYKAPFVMPLAIRFFDDLRKANTPASVTITE